MPGASNCSPFREAVRLVRAISCAARQASLVTLVVFPAVAAATDVSDSSVGDPPSAFRSELVKPGLYRIAGAGGTALLRSTSEGLILVDSMGAGSYGPLMAEIQRVTGSPSPRIKALILTGAGRAQAGNVSQFAKTSVPIIVHKRAGLEVPGLEQGHGTTAPRVVTYDADYQLHSGDAVAEVEHVGSGRTRADSIVLFPDLRVAAIGQLFTAETTVPECAAGGSLAGWSAAIAHLLWSDFDIAVPSSGPPIGKSELVALKRKLEAMAERQRSSSEQASCPSLGNARQ